MVYSSLWKKIEQGDFVGLKTVRRLVPAMVGMAFLLTGCGDAESGRSGSRNGSPDRDPIQSWEMSEDSNGRFREIVAYADEIGSAAVLVLYRGEVAFRYGDIEKKYMCHSIRKTFLGALYGIYRERDMIDLDATLEELEIDDIPPSLTSMEKQARVRDLLAAQSGVYHEAAGEVQSMRDARPSRGSHPPGVHFYYNNWDFNALGTIFTRFTGKGVFEAFDEEIAVPIGMEDFSIDDGTYVYERERSEHPSYFFRMSSRDMARFGLLYANMGAWNGKQIVPEMWVLMSTTPTSLRGIHNDPYGYLWSIIPEKAGLGYGFYHTGMGVHLLAVLPDRELVMVHRVDTDGDFDIRWSEIRRLMEMVFTAVIEG